MKIALSSGNTGLNARVSPIFGRTRYFVFVDVENGGIAESDTVENTAADQTRGAGRGAVELLTEQNAEVLITGNVGTSSLTMLQQYNITPYEKVGGTVEENVKKFIQGELEEIETASRPPGRRGGL